MLKIEFPPVRNCFIPDLGYRIFDIDLAGADAQVVAWDAGDEDLKNAFKKKLKIHVKNGCDVWGRDVMYATDPGGKSEPAYTRIKRAVHLTNYGGKAATCAAKCDMSVPEATLFQENWLHVLHPAIGEWHKKTEFDLQTTGVTTNKFGYSIPWNDRPESLLPEALAWIPQSTIAHVTEEAMIRMDDAELDLDILLQCHDSLVFQIKQDRVKPVLRDVYSILHSIEVPYDDPLIIPWGIKTSLQSWGQCKDTTWEDLIGELPSESHSRTLDKHLSEVH